MRTSVLVAFLVMMLCVETTYAQRITVDWALHDAGEVRQLITNLAKNNKRGTDFPGLINSEFPPNSFVEHVGDNGIYIGGLPDGSAAEQAGVAGDTLVSVAMSFNSPNEMEGYSDAPWDSVWAASRGDTVQVPYQVPYPDGSYYVPGRDSGYTPISDQDFITRFNDYGQNNLEVSEHDPLYIDVVQTSYAWGSPPLDDVVIINYGVVATRFDVEDVYIANFVDGAVGYRTGASFPQFASDDYVQYYEVRHTAITIDTPGGGDSGEWPPLATKLIPPENPSAEELTWTWVWGARFSEVLPRFDPERYEQMTSGSIYSDQQEQLTDHIHYSLMAGPFDLPQGDTLNFSVAMIFGEDEEEVLQNESVVERLRQQDFQVPKPPPIPDVEVNVEEGRVDLSWEKGHEAVEDYTDPHRADSVEQPFEGYRVWKSTQSEDGPWTLLGEYDLVGNQFEYNSGLRHHYTNSGLVNNVEYYYAVTAFSKPDTVLNWPSQQTSRTATAQTVVPGSGPQDQVGDVAVVPNPYRGDVRYQDYNPPWEKPPPSRERWLEQDRRLQFVNLPPQARIEVYTLDGTHVQTLRHNSTERGFKSWDLVSRAGQAIASGIYLFTVENLETGRTQTGKFVIIK